MDEFSNHLFMYFVRNTRNSLDFIFLHFNHHSDMIRYRQRISVFFLNRVLSVVGNWRSILATNSLPTTIFSSSISFGFSKTVRFFFSAFAEGHRATNKLGGLAGACLKTPITSLARAANTHGSPRQPSTLPAKAENMVTTSSAAPISLSSLR